MSIVVILSTNNQPHWNNNEWHHLTYIYISLYQSLKLIYFNQSMFAESSAVFSSKGPERLDNPRFEMLNKTRTLLWKIIVTTTSHSYQVTSFQLPARTKGKLNILSSHQDWSSVLLPPRYSQSWNCEIEQIVFFLISVFFFPSNKYRMQFSCSGCRVGLRDWRTEQKRGETEMLSEWSSRSAKLRKHFSFPSHSRCNHQWWSQRYF